MRNTFLTVRQRRLPRSAPLSISDLVHPICADFGYVTNETNRKHLIVEYPVFAVGAEG
jgi:hypothetical protein